jgi:hypothetical protein
MECDEPLVDLVTRKVTEAIHAHDSGDYPGALALLEQAEMALAVTPDGKVEDGEVAFDREAINRSITTLRRRISSRGGVVEQHVRYRRG